VTTTTTIPGPSPPERALRALRHAYDADVPVWVRGQTRRLANGSAFSVNRTAAKELVDEGLARYSVPQGRFLLLTPGGKQRVGLAAQQ
jgi:hypothetical protein